MHAHANGIRIHYGIDGREDAPWVTFITGIANDLTMWDGQIAELEEDFREVLVLRDVEDLTYEEIMDITGLAEGTVKSRIHRGRTLLKQRVTRRLGDKL